ncbi:Serine/threonine-protein kinase TNNI3K [Exaiptasia diaphana]|nr:Serine/threonine-protein kinase TNNI3K [Exaiptasia diaphana]
MTKQERKNKLTLGLQDKVNDLLRKLDSSKKLYKKEKRISAYCWRKWKEDNRVAIQTQSQLSNENDGSDIFIYSIVPCLITLYLFLLVSRELVEKISKNNESSPEILGQGCFGKCVKMKYRDITVAVKKYETFVTPASVLLEASVIHKFDHPGNCITLSKAKKLSLVEEVRQYISVFTDIADALDYVHGKGYLHNDIKGDNVLLTKDSIYHGVLIDFGKSRKVKHAKMYKLKREEQTIYRNKYWHIAPELVQGQIIDKLILYYEYYTTNY